MGKQGSRRRFTHEFEAETRGESFSRIRATQIHRQAVARQEPLHPIRDARSIVAVREFRIKPEKRHKYLFMWGVHQNFAAVRKRHLELPACTRGEKNPRSSVNRALERAPLGHPPSHRPKMLYLAPGLAPLSLSTRIVPAKLGGQSRLVRDRPMQCVTGCGPMGEAAASQPACLARGPSACRANREARIAGAGPDLH